MLLVGDKNLIAIRDPGDVSILKEHEKSVDDSEYLTGSEKSMRIENKFDPNMIVLSQICALESEKLKKIQKIKSVNKCI